MPILTPAWPTRPSRDEALEEAQDCLEEVIAQTVIMGEALPKPSPARGRPLVRPGVLMAAKAALGETNGGR